MPRPSRRKRISSRMTKKNSSKDKTPKNKDKTPKSKRAKRDISEEKLDLEFTKEVSVRLETLTKQQVLHQESEVINSDVKIEELEGSLCEEQSLFSYGSLDIPQAANFILNSDRSLNAIVDEMMKESCIESSVNLEPVKQEDVFTSQLEMEDIMLDGVNGAISKNSESVKQIQNNPTEDTKAISSPDNSKEFKDLKLALTQNEEIPLQEGKQHFERTQETIEAVPLQATGVINNPLPQPPYLQPQHPILVPQRLNMEWVTRMEDTRNRLRTTTQEISRLNALLVRARRTLWPRRTTT